MTKLDNGPLVQELKQKGVQVFMNYCAGGPDNQIAVEQQANAASNGLLNVAARNAMGVPEMAGVAQEQQKLLPLTREEEVGRILLLKEMGQQAQLIGSLPVSLEKATEQYSIFSETRIKYARLEAEQERELAEKAAEQKRLLDEKAVEQKLALAAKEVEHEGLMQRKKRRFEAEDQYHSLEVDMVKKEVEEGRMGLEELRRIRREAMMQDAEVPVSVPVLQVMPSSSIQVAAAAVTSPVHQQATLLPVHQQGPVAAAAVLAEGQQQQQAGATMPFRYNESLEEGMSPYNVQQARLKWDCLIAMYTHGNAFTDVLGPEKWSRFIEFGASHQNYSRSIDNRIAK